MRNDAGTNYQIPPPLVHVHPANAVRGGAGGGNPGSSFWEDERCVLWEAIDVPVLLRTVLTVFGIVMLILVRYAERIFDADEDGEYVPCPKYLFYVWLPFFLVAIRAGAVPAIFFIVGGALCIANELYSTFFAGSYPS